MLLIFCLFLLSLYLLLAIDMWSVLLRRTGWSRFIHTFLLFYAQIIATQFIIGLFHALTGYVLALLNLFISTLLIVWVTRKAKKNFLQTYFRSFKTTWIEFTTTFKHDPYWGILLTIGVLFVIWIIFLGIIFPSLDYDGNSYHLTFIANSLQHNTFLDPPTSLSWLIGYPKGGEFIQMWSVLLTNKDIFTDLAQIPFLVLGVYALYQIALTFGVKKEHARFSALLFLFIPVVLNQLKTTYVDVMLASLFFTSIALILSEKLKKRDLPLLGIVFSLIISIKSTGFLFVATVVPLLLWKLYTQQKKELTFAKNYIVPLLYVLLPTFFGFYWYIKNFIVYGTPIYPFGFKLLGHSIFPGQTFQEFASNAVNTTTSLPQGCVQRIWFVWTEQRDWYGCLYNYDTNYAGLGPIWFVVLIPAFLLSLYLAIKKRNGLFLAVSTTILALFLIYPANYYSRYTLFIVAIGILGLGYVLTHISRLSSYVVKGLCVVLALSVVATNFVLCNYTPITVKNQFKSVVKGSARGSVYTSFPGTAYVFLTDRMQSGEVVAYDSKPFFIYPLWKPDFSNTVLYLPAESETDWIQELETKQVRYIFTTIHSKENNWAEDEFDLIYKDELYEIFQVY